MGELFHYFGDLQQTHCIFCLVGVKLNKKAVAFGRYSNPLRKFYLEFVSNTPSLQFACCIGDSVQVSWWSFLFV